MQPRLRASLLVLAAVQLNSILVWFFAAAAASTGWAALARRRQG